MPLPKVAQITVPEPPVIVPCIGILVLFPHTVVSAPAWTFGTGVILITSVSDTEAQLPLWVEVRISLTDFAIVSAVLKL